MAIRRKKRWREVEATLTRNVQEAVASSAVMLQGAMKLELSRGKTRDSGAAAAGSPPNMMTGNLRRSIQINLSRLKEPVSRARVGTNLVYGRIQEYGGIIVPRHARALVVPVNFEASTALRRAGGNVRAVPGLSMITTKKSVPMLVRKLPGGNRYRAVFRPMFVLVKRVTIRPHPYMRPAVAKTRNAIMDRFHARFLLKA